MKLNFKKTLNSTSLTLSFLISITISYMLGLCVKSFFILAFLLLIGLKLIIRKKEQTSLSKSPFIKVFIIIVVVYKLLILGLNISHEKFEKKWIVTDLKQNNKDIITANATPYEIYLINSEFKSFQKDGVYNLKYQLLFGNNIKINSGSIKRSQDKNPWFDNPEIQNLNFVGKYKYEYSLDTLVIINEKIYMKLIQNKN